MESRFDTLAKLLANGMSEVSRREALRRLGGTAAGAVLATLGLGCRDDVVGPSRPTGLARPLLQQGNSDFAHFCNTVFPPGPERGRCKSLAAHGEGLAVACDGDVTRVCATTTGLICCNLAAGETCCPTATQCCPPGRVCSPTGCVCPPGTLTCGTSCCPAGETCCAGACCGVGRICFNDVCRAACPGGQTPCGSTNCCAAPRICNPASGTCVCPPNTGACGADCCDLQQDREACIDGQCVELFRFCGVEPCPSFPVRHACCSTVIGIDRCCPPLAFCGGPTGCCLLEDPIFGVCLTPV
jgi:hypothetical protein